MPNVNNGESGSLVRSKMNAVLGAVELIASPAALVADTALTYTTGQARTVSVGTIIMTVDGGHRYQVVASGATTYDLQTAGGVRVLLLPNGSGWYDFDGMNPTKGGTGDNLAKLQTLLTNKTTFVSGVGTQGPSVWFAPGVYAFSATINVKTICRLYGHNLGFGNSNQTEFVFPAATAGIIVHRADTIGALNSNGGNGGNADGSEIVGIRLRSARGSAFSETQSGIWLRARGLVQRCSINSFAGHGVYVGAGSDGNPYQGNANLFQIDHVYVQFCRGSAVHIQGTDANAGTCRHVNGVNNDLWCINESSFLGNYHYGHHSESNLAGSYFGLNTSALNGCYAEDGVGGTARWGGIAIGNAISVFDLTNGGGTSGSAPVLGLEFANGPRGLSNFNGGFVANHLGMQTHLGTDGDTMVRGTFPGNSQPLRLGTFINSGQDAVVRWASSANNLLQFGSASSTRNFGRSAAVGEHLNIWGMFLGLNNNGRYMTYGSAAPTSGNYAAGDIVFNNSPTAGGKIGWVCVTAGNPGTWKTWGAIDP